VTIAKLVGNLGTRRRGCQADYEQANQIPNVIMKLQNKLTIFQILVINLQVRLAQHVRDRKRRWHEQKAQ
jgi:hypothetical protein